MENNYNFNGLSSFLQVFNEEKTCREFLEYLRWEGKPYCPHCKYEEKIYKFKNGKTYKCGKCKLDFTITVGTIFQNTRIPIRKWFIAIYLFASNKTGVSSHQMAKHLEIAQRNAWVILHKIRKVMEESEQFKKIMEGIIECDETYVGGKNKNRHWVVSGIYYLDALRKAGNEDEADRVMREILKNLDKSPINIDKLFKKTNFLKDNTDFGKMEHGVVE